MKTIKFFIILITLIINNSMSMITDSNEELLMSFEEVTKPCSNKSLNPTIIELTSSKSDLEELEEIFKLEQQTEKRRTKIYKELKEALGE